YQETKAPFIEAVHLCKESLEIVRLFASRMEVDEERLQAACTDELFATDRALDLARQGTPFRDAYLAVATTTHEPEQTDLAARLRARAHEGAPGNLDLDGVAARISAEQAAWDARRAHFEKAIAA